MVQRPWYNELQHPSVDVDAVTFDLQNLITSSAGASEYFMSALAKLFKPFMRYRGKNIGLDKWTDELYNGTA